VVTAFIEENKDRFGVEPICRVLTEHGVPIAPSTYYAARTRPPSAWALRDAQLVEHIERVFFDPEKGRGISGARKVWRLLRREGIDVARCTVERLMRQQGLRGIRRGKQVVTTRPDPQAGRAPDLVDRDFTAGAPNQLWVVDFTYVPTWSGMAFTAFVTDVFSRRIVGWRTASRMPTELPLDALEMALWVRECAGATVDGLIHHSDAGASTPCCATPTGLPTSGRWPPSAASVTPSTTRWPKAWSGSTRTSASRSTARSAPSTSSNWRPCPGSTGSTTTGCTPRSAT
jgi:putative transposase